MYIFKKQNYFDFVSNFPTYWVFPCKLFTKLKKDFNKTQNITRTVTGEKIKRLENLTWIQKLIKIFSIWFFDHIHHIKLNFHQWNLHNLSLKEKNVNMGSILFGRKWLKLDEILVQNISFQQFDLLSFSIKAIPIKF